MRQSISKFIPILAALLAAAGLSAYLTKRTQPRVGVVDNNVLMSQFSEAIQAQKNLDALEAEWKANIKTIGDSLHSVMDSLSDRYAKANEADRKKMQDHLNHWNEEYSRYTGAVEKMRTLKQKEILTPVLEKVNGFVRNWASQHGYQILLGTGNGGVILSVAEAQNVTHEVLADLNKLYAVPTAIPRDSIKNASAGK